MHYIQNTNQADIQIQIQIVILYLGMVESLLRASDN